MKARRREPLSEDSKKGYYNSTGYDSAKPSNTFRLIQYTGRKTIFGCLPSGFNDSQVPAKSPATDKKRKKLRQYLFPDTLSS